MGPLEVGDLGTQLRGGAVLLVALLGRATLRGQLDRQLGLVELLARLGEGGVRRLAARPRSAPLMDCWRRSRRLASSRSRSITSWWRTLAVERKNFSLGIPV